MLLIKDNKLEKDIWNLFFYIKAKFGDENYQIHNKSYSINSLTVDNLKKVENKEEEKTWKIRIKVKIMIK